MVTKFGDVYDLFLGSIEAKLYINMTPEQTKADLQTFLLLSIAQFKYCKLNLLDYNLESKTWNILLTIDEISHLVLIMKKIWIDRQIKSDNVLDQKTSLIKISKYILKPII